jgi:hypothetical protein
MSARSELVRFLLFGPCTQTDADELIDAYLAETLRAAAEDVLASDPGPRPGHSQAYTDGWSDATHRARSRLLARAQNARQAVDTPDPSFFQPGRTYTFSNWTNRPGLITHTTRTMTVTHIETAPDGSKRVAIGWEQIDGKPYLLGVEDMDGWTLADGEGQ